MARAREKLNINAANGNIRSFILWLFDIQIWKEVGCDWIREEITRTLNRGRTLKLAFQVTTPAAEKAIPGLNLLLLRSDNEDEGSEIKNRCKTTAINRE